MGSERSAWRRGLRGPTTGRRPSSEEFSLGSAMGRPVSAGKPFCVEGISKSPFGLRKGLSPPCFVAQPSHNHWLCSGFAPRLPTKYSLLASKNNFEMPSSDKGPENEVHAHRRIGAEVGLDPLGYCTAPQQHNQQRVMEAAGRIWGLIAGMIFSSLCEKLERSCTLPHDAGPLNATGRPWCSS